MYLEISGRQTGKTTRLVDDVKKNFNRYDNVFIFTLSRQSVGDLQVQLGLFPMFVKKSGGFPMSDEEQCFFEKINVHSYHELAAGKHIFQDYYFDPKNKFYFDEFDFINYDYKMRQSLPILRKNSYYVTTPRQLRKRNYMSFYGDNLLMLLRKNNYKKKRYLNLTLDPKVFGYEEMGFYFPLSQKQKFMVEKL